MRQVPRKVKVLLALLATLGPGCQRPTAAPPPEPEAAAPGPAAAAPVLWATPFSIPGVRRPPVRPAAEAALPDDAPVVGVLAGGRPRAYLLGAMRKQTHHVLDDVLGETPVTVTYCDRADCIRAFTADPAGQPLAVDLGGWIGEAMLLRVGQVFYRQDTGKSFAVGHQADFPFAPLPFERTTWGAWKKAHPDTDVFTG